MMRLGRFAGKQQAHDRVYEACQRSIEEGVSLFSVLSRDPEITDVLSTQDLQELLEPANYVGLAPFFVDNVIQKLVGNPEEEPMM